MTFVDRKSRLVRVEFLRKKSEATQKAKNFIAWVKTSETYILKILIQMEVENMLLRI